jgi:Tol biopolymer transport system component
VSDIHPQQIGPYTISGELGRGGMGVVYLGHDSRLDRDVAIKSLPQHFATEPERLARFEREAKTLASLNHPNIAGIHGVENVDGAMYLILEYVAGETLADRLDRGALSVDDAIDFCAQIAAGVEAAHEAGVIHRDLKPANIKITPEGVAKVLDFGLARTEETSTSGSSVSQLPTLTTPHSPTTPGAILGTAPYMSPEQARGRRVDKRSDIWSFGVLLYECLTGASPFIGETATDSIGAILHKDVDLKHLPTETPEGVRRVIARCIERDKSMRLRDIGDARIELLRPTAHEVQGGAAKRLATSRIVGIALVLVTALAGLASWSAWLAPGAPAPKVMRLRAQLSTEDFLLTQDAGSQFAISPDGAFMVFAGEKSIEGTNLLYIRALDQFEATPLTGTSNARNPFFSPDGRWIGYATSNKLKKVSITGGASLTLCDVDNDYRGASWGDNGMIVYSPNTNSGLWIVPDTGGTPEELTALDETANERSHRWPYMLPGSKAVLFTSQVRGDSFNNTLIELYDFETGKRAVLHRGGSSPSYTPSGHIVFGRDGSLFAVPFDLDTLTVRGSPAPVLEEIQTNSGNGGTPYNFSETGVLMYQAGGEFIQSQAMWADRQGATSLLDPTPRNILSTMLSPDESRLAYQLYGIESSNFDIWVYEIKRNVLSRLTFSNGNEMNPIWSPDGEFIVYSDSTASKPILMRKRADGSSDAERLMKTEDVVQFASDWSSDGRYIMYQEQSQGDSGWDLVYVEIDDSDPEPILFLGTPYDEIHGVFSPDGKWVAYESDESGQGEIYVRPFPSGGGRWQISSAGGIYPAWSEDGSELFFIENGSITAVGITNSETSISIGAATRVMPFKPKEKFFNGQYNVTQDEQRFVISQVINQNTGEQDPSALFFVFNWFEDLKRKLEQTR